MSNKLFILLLAVLSLPFFGWMIYDSRVTLAEIQKASGNHDVLMGRDGAMAQVQYLFHFAEPVFIHSLNTSQIEALSHSGGDAEHYHVYGLTKADYGTGTSYNFNWSKKWFKEEYSMWVEDLRVDFTYKTVNVYVTSHYPEDSCEYQATLEHEKRHVAIHEQVYSRYQEILREGISKSSGLPLSSHPITASSIPEGKKIMEEMITKVMDPVFDQFKTELAAEQAKIDTPESYEALKEHCPNW